MPWANATHFCAQHANKQTQFSAAKVHIKVQQISTKRLQRTISQTINLYRLRSRSMCWIVKRVRVVVRTVVFPFYLNSPAPMTHACRLMQFRVVEKFELFINCSYFVQGWAWVVLLLSKAGVRWIFVFAGEEACGCFLMQMWNSLGLISEINVVYICRVS